MGEDKEEIKTSASSENGTQVLAQVSTLEVVTITVLSNVIVRVNIVSNISLLICAVQLFLFLPKTLSSLNTSFISLKFLQRD